MNEEQIADLWNLFKEYLDKKHIDLAAEKYVDLLADYGVDDIVFKEVTGTDKHLDSAINYYLEIDEDEDDWEEDQ
jgi:hypothetical protein|tara:strand:- start:53 stop:277 length:225 start_codon:yes stop_codon:yes gene_type:complete